jgi:hypothetical protein|tara:strand:- start:155 stop:379 length:225 start_codon:yes stop_codon:yes gene_type:complete
MKQLKDVRESPFIAPTTLLIDTIFDKLRKDLNKAFKKNEKDATAMLSQLAKLAGYGITKKAQRKGQSYRWDLKK